ncbi:MAG: dehydrogenase subunit [Pseudomonadota bacterium]
MDSLLSIVTFLPILGAAVVALLPERSAKVSAMAVSVLALLASIPLWTGFDPGSAEAYQFVQNVPWIERFGVSYHLGIDGVSLVLVLLTTAMMPIIVAAGFSGVERNHRAYYALMLVLEGAMIGSFVALDTFLFYLFWEAVLLPMYLLVGIWGGENRIYAAVKLFLYTAAGSLLMLVAFIALYQHQAATGTPSTDLLRLLELDIPRSMQLWCFAAFALAFAIKVPMFPVHTWLPDAHVQAPTGGSVVLAGVMLKMGTYGFYRFAMPLFPEGVTTFGPVIIALSVIGIVYGALVAMVQDDVKKLVAYSSVSHMGFVMLGLFALNAPGVTGGVYQMLNHGVSTGALFLLVGVLYERRHTRRIVDYGGLSKVVPVFATFFMLVTFSSIGLPLLNGFVGEFMILLGAFQFAPLPTVVAASGVIFGAAYMLWMFQRVMFGPLTNHANATLTDMNLREIAYMAPLAIAIVVMGVYPQPVLDRVQPSVDRFLVRMAQEGHYGGGSPYAASAGTPSWVGPRPVASEPAAPHHGAEPASHPVDAAPAAEGTH